LVDEGIIWDDYEQIGVFSWTRQTRPEAVQLPGNWDNRGFDLWGLRMSDTYNPMHDTWNKKIVFVDGCNSGVSTLVNGSNDMAWAYGVYSLQGYGSLDQIYIGWRLPLSTSKERIAELFGGDTTQGVRMFWEQMGLGKSVGAAFRYIDQFGSPQAQKTMFGDSVFDNGVGDDNIRIYGHGGGNRLNDITLNNN
jgi:hypothetical protein